MNEQLLLDFSDIEIFVVEARLIEYLEALTESDRGAKAAMSVQLVRLGCGNVHAVVVGEIDGERFQIAGVERHDHPAPAIAFVERLTAALDVRGLTRSERLK